METKLYHCMDSNENPIPYWLHGKTEQEPKKELDLVEQFKKNPDSFFPDFNTKKMKYYK